MFAILLSVSQAAQASTIDCEFSQTINYWELGRVYRCVVSNNPNITTVESALVSSSTGGHWPMKTNSDVVAFDSDQKSIEHFPRGLEKVFVNLKLISIWYGRIKEIHQSDLKPYRKLVYLNLFQNDIEILEDGLFDYNPDLAVLSFSNNKIYHIDNDALESVPKLLFLDLFTNPCISMTARNSRKMVLEIIRIAQNKCRDEDYVRSQEKSNRIAKSRKFKQVS